MFEKYDGVRGFWNPLKKAFFSRKGNKFPFPQEIIDSMPTDLFLDGELWYFPFLPQLGTTCCSLLENRFGRDNFQEAMKISNRVELSQIDWNKFKFMVFDVPSMQSSSFAERYAALCNI